MLVLVLVLGEVVDWTWPTHGTLRRRGGFGGGRVRRVWWRMEVGAEGIQRLIGLEDSLPLTTVRCCVSVPSVRVGVLYSK